MLGSIIGVKVSVSIPEDDLAFVDDYARRRGVGSRSAVLHDAIELLRMSELEDAYAAAWDEWEGTEEARLWDGTAGDGITDAAR
jgi:Arc/MetJ-type ribon-helix-helix transcriptional regulator